MDEITMTNQTPLTIQQTNPLSSVISSPYTMPNDLHNFFPRSHLDLQEKNPLKAKCPLDERIAEIQCQ